MSGKKIDRDVLEKHLASTLDINRFRDYCPNGLQVEGGEQVQYLVSGVTASLALIEAALEEQYELVTTVPEERGPVEIWRLR